MKTVSAIHAFAALRDAGTVLKTVPDFEKLYEDAFYPVVDYFVAIERDPEELKRKVMIPDVVTNVAIEEVSLEKQLEAPAPAKAPLPVAAAKSAPTEAAPAPVPEAAPLAESAAAEAEGGQGRRGTERRRGPQGERSVRFHPPSGFAAHRQSSEPRLRDRHQQGHLQPDLGPVRRAHGRLIRLGGPLPRDAQESFSTSFPSSSPLSRRAPPPRT